LIAQRSDVSTEIDVRQTALEAISRPDVSTARRLAGKNGSGGATDIQSITDIKMDG
jgi:hypothetical protein